MNREARSAGLRGRSKGWRPHFEALEPRHLLSGSGCALDDVAAGAPSAVMVQGTPVLQGKLEVDTNGEHANGQLPGLIFYTSSATLPVNGLTSQQVFLDVYVEIPPGSTLRASGYEASLRVEGNPAGVRFTGAVMAVAPHVPLFAGQAPIVVATGTRLGVTDFLLSGDVRIENGAGLFRAAVTIDPGVAGQFRLAFDPVFTNIADRQANPLPIEAFRPGTITVGQAVTPAISISDASVVEGNSGVRDAVFTVTLSQPSTETVTVDFVTIPGTATEGVDYSFSGGRLAFTPGQTTRTISIAVVGDTLPEPDETFTVQLSNPIGATLAVPLGRGTIIDDDGQLAFPWQNPRNRFDVNDNGSISAIDVLIIINEINAHGPRNLPVPPVPPQFPPPYYDAHGDNALTAQDALVVINAVNEQVSSQRLLRRNPGGAAPGVDPGLVALALASMTEEELGAR